MVTKLPHPYLLDVQGEVPNTYLIGLGAGYVATLGGETLVRDSNAFQAFLGRYSDKTGIKFDKGIFGHELFRRVFVLTLANLYSAYTSARSQYLISQKVPEDRLPLYTTYDDKLIMLEFFGESSYENLDEILRRNKDVHDAILSKIPAKLENELPKELKGEMNKPNGKNFQQQGGDQKKNNRE